MSVFVTSDGSVDIEQNLNRAYLTLYKANLA
jgi:hypothetical protein